MNIFLRYTNKVSVEPRVYKNLKLFMENKEDDDDLFDRLSVRRKKIFSMKFCFFSRRQVLINI